jgi:hypothetical protein
MSNMDTAFGTTSRVEDKAITSTSAVAATFTGAAGGDNYITFAVFVPDAAGGAAADAYLSMPPLAPARR